MLFLRRILTVVPGLLLLAFFLLAVASCQFSATFLSADFYKDRLSSADFYRFATTDLPLTAVGEFRRSGSGSEDFDQFLLMTSGLSDHEIVDSLNRVLPPDWLRDTLEQAMDEIVPYTVGERDGLTLRVDLNEKAETLVEEVKYLLRESDAYAFLSEKIGEIVAEDVAEAAGELGFSVNTDRIQQAVMSALTADWLQAEIESRLDKLPPYILGETDTFDMRSEIGEVARRAAEEAKRPLQEAGVHERLYETVLEPTIADGIFQTLGGQSTVDILERLRGELSTGPVWTEQDLLSLIESEFGREEAEAIEQARSWASSIRSLRGPAWLIVILLLASIGMLGGRNWPSRVSWAAAYLVGTTAILFAAFQALGSTWNSQTEDAKAEALGQIELDSNFARSQEIITDKSFEIVADMGNVFIDGLATQSMIGFVIGVAALAGVVGWRYWQTKTGKLG